MWLLVATVCLADGAYAECEKYARPPVMEKGECWKMRDPVADLIAQNAEASDLGLVYLHIECTRGAMS